MQIIRSASHHLSVLTAPCSHPVMFSPRRVFSSTKWQKAAEIPGAVCEGRVPDLVEGMQYKFRVRAVNKAGPGAPSGESKTMTAKARFGMHSMLVRSCPLCSKVFMVNYVCTDVSINI